MQSGGEILVRSLINLGAQTSFGVPGESYLPVLDALHDTAGQLDFVLCRNEGGAAYMAAAYGKLTATPGLCWVTRGPGATAGLSLTNDDMIFALFRKRRAEPAGREGRSSCFAPICATQSDNVSLV